MNHASRLGRHAYRMRKTDFQMEKDLSGSLRSMKPLGSTSLLEDRFDSVYRRNLLAPEAKDGDHRRRSRKTKFKFHNSKAEHAGEMQRKLLKKNKNIDDYREGTSGMLKNDLILI